MAHNPYHREKPKDDFLDDAARRARDDSAVAWAREHSPVSKDTDQPIVRWGKDAAAAEMMGMANLSDLLTGKTGVRLATNDPDHIGENDPQFQAAVQAQQERAAERAGEGEQSNYNSVDAISQFFNTFDQGIPDQDTAAQAEQTYAPYLQSLAEESLKVDAEYDQIRSQVEGQYAKAKGADKQRLANVLNDLAARRDAAQTAIGTAYTQAADEIGALEQAQRQQADVNASEIAAVYGDAMKQAQATMGDTTQGVDNAAALGVSQSQVGGAGSDQVQALTAAQGREAAAARNIANISADQLAAMQASQGNQNAAQQGALQRAIAMKQADAEQASMDNQAALDQQLAQALLGVTQDEMATNRGLRQQERNAELQRDQSVTQQNNAKYNAILQAAMQAAVPTVAGENFPSPQADATAQTNAAYQRMRAQLSNQFPDDPEVAEALSIVVPLAVQEAGNNQPMAAMAVRQQLSQLAATNPALKEKLENGEIDVNALIDQARV